MRYDKVLTGRPRCQSAKGFHSRGLWVIVLAMMVAGGRVRAADNTDDKTIDWPTVISKLHQEMYQRSGNAQTRQQLAVAYNNYGVSLGDQSQWSLATEQFEEAMRLDTGNERFKVNLSRLYLKQAHMAYQQHQTQEATQAVNRAIAVDPDLAEAYALLGELEYSNQHLKEARAAWTRSLTLDPHQSELSKRLSQVTKELPVESDFERLSQAYFDLRYEEQIERSLGFDIRDALLEARRAVGSDFAYWPKHKIVVLLYSAESFRRLRQETPDWVAGQFDGKIRVPLPNGIMDQATVKQILFHEYTHAVIFDVANGKCPVWLNEGLAEYEGRTQRPSPTAELARAAAAGHLISWAELSDHFSAAMSRDEVALAYQESYSIMHHFVKHYGFWRIRRILKSIGEGKPWEAVLAEELRLKLPRVEATWRESLPELLKQTP